MTTTDGAADEFGFGTGVEVGGEGEGNGKVTPKLKVWERRESGVDGRGTWVGVEWSGGGVVEE